MPVLSLPSFAKGEIGPSLYGRVDTNMYKVALRTARNAIIHSYGGVSNRPGTLCISPFKFHTEALFPRLFRFHLGTSDQYVLEFGNLYMRVVRNDAQVLNTTIPITGATAADPVVVTVNASTTSTDPNFSSNVLLLPFDGADAATTTDDASPSAHTITFNGSAQLDTARQQFGSASLLTDGSTSDFLTAADSTDWTLGSSEFTIECWVNWDVLPSTNSAILSHWFGTGDQRGWQILFNNTAGDLSFSYSTDGTAGTTVAVTSGADDGFVVDTWHHIAIVRDGNTLRIFVNGTQTTTADVTGVTIFNSTEALHLMVRDNTGARPAGDGSDFWMDDVRITVGVARYTGNFTVPAVAHPLAGHGYVNGDDVFINMTAGMVQLNKRRFLVRKVTTTTFELEDQITGVAVDGTSYDAYTTGGDVAQVFELTTPYVQADLPTLKMVQRGNTLSITHLNYAPRDLTRTDHNVWPLSTPSYAPTIAAPTNGGITSTFDSNFQVFTQGGLTVNYQITAISDTDGSFEESLPLTITGTDGSDPPLNTLTWDTVAAATRYAVYRRDNGLYGLLGETELLSFEDKNLATDLTISPPASRNPFLTDFVMASGYYQQRQVYGGTVLFPDKSFYSQTGLRLNMSVSTPLQPADAITASLSSQDVQEIRHYVPIGNDLMVMTNAGEWRVNSGPDSNFSQDTIKQQPETNWGSSHDVPIVVGKTILFVEDGGARVRSLGFSLEIDGFDTNDLTVLANHLLADKSADEFIISDWTYGQFPEPRIYMVRSDGKVLTMTFDIEQKVIAWTTWDTRGQFKTTTSLRRSVDGVEDGIYFGVRRKTALGGDANFLERLHTRKFADIRNGFFVDLGVQLDNKFKITNITSANPAVFTTESDHGFADGDEIEVVEIEWFKDIADECSDDTPNLFNDLRFTVANKTDDTFELLDFTTLGSSAGFDLQQGCSFEAVLNVSAQEEFSEGITFNSTGLKMYVSGLQLVYQYSLGVAHDALTATPDGVTLNTAPQNSRPAGGLQLTNSGTRLYVFKTSSGKLFQYNLSVADDLNTAIYSGKSKDMPHLGGGFVFSADGTKIFFVRKATTDKIFEMHLTDPVTGAAASWELDNDLTTQATLDISGDVSNSNGISFNSDGLIMHVPGRVLASGLEGVHQWALLSAYSLPGAVYTTVCVIGPDFGRKLADIAWKTDGSRFFLPRSTFARVEQFAVPLSGASSEDVGLSGTSETYKRGGEVRKTVTVIRDLGCLEGLEAVLFFDGSQEPNQTVVDAAITVDDGRSIARAAIGLPYTCDIELLDIEVGSGTASTEKTLQSKLKKVNSVTVRFYKSRMPQVGPRSDYLTQMRPRQFEKFDQASQLISGDVSVAIKPNWNSNGRIFFRQCDPVPLTILAVFPDISLEDELE